MPLKETGGNEGVNSKRKRFVRVIFLCTDVGMTVSKVTVGRQEPLFSCEGLEYRGREKPFCRKLNKKCPNINPRGRGGGNGWQ